MRICLDMLGVSRQHGLMPAVGSRTERAMAGRQRVTSKLRQVIRPALRLLIAKQVSSVSRQHACGVLFVCNLFSPRPANDAAADPCGCPALNPADPQRSPLADDPPTGAGIESEREPRAGGNVASSCTGRDRKRAVLLPVAVPI
jgi:hypothetical protein